VLPPQLGYDPVAVRRPARRVAQARPPRAAGAGRSRRRRRGRGRGGRGRRRPARRRRDAADQRQPQTSPGPDAKGGPHPMTTRPAQTVGSPWRLGDAMSLLTLNAVGIALVIAGWYVAGGRLLLHHAVSGANVAIAGIIVAGVGNAVWLLTGRRAVGMP